jgi:hypothetical protein
MSSEPKHAGSELLERKQAVFAEQAKKREREKPMADAKSVVYAKELLATLERMPARSGPIRIDMSGPPPLANDEIPTKGAEPIGGCFADIHDDEPTRSR